MSEREGRWTNPLTVAVAAAAIAGFSNAFLAYQNNRAELALEAKRAESERVLEMVKAGDPARVRENLRFLLQLGLVQDEELRRRIEIWEGDPNRAPVYLSPAAIAAFQREAGLPADGRVGPLTRQRMEAARPRPANGGGNY